MKRLYLLLLVGFIAGCQQHPYSQTYLMQHPHLLKNEVEKCQTSNERTVQQVEQCRKVVSAANQFVEILKQQQGNPEQFGEKIINAEITLSSLKEELKIAKNNLEEIKKHGNPEQTIEAESKIQELKKRYQTLNNEIKIDLAVVGVNSPE